MLTDEGKHKILNKILETKDFNSSRIYKKLLTYLVDASLKGIKLKEITIAIDVFEKDSNFNPSEDSSIRVYISNLRKKLDHYYSNDGKNDKYKIVLPKGHYDLEFISAKQKNQKRVKIKDKFLLYSAFAIIVVLFVLILKYDYFFSKSANSNIPSILKNSVWKNITESDNPKLIVLGNDLFFLERQNGEETIVRKHYINTIEEFKKYKETHPEKDIIGIVPYPFFPKIDISIIPILVKIFNAKDKLHLKSSMELTTSDLLENDIVFLGSFRSMHFLNYLLEDSLVDYSANPENMFIRINDKDTSIIFKQLGEPGQEHIDYCLFRKIPGPNKNTIYMFISFFESGISLATQYMLEEKGLNEITEMMKKRYGKIPNYFEVLFESKGYSRTGVKTSVEYFRKITPEELNIW
jgi:hypothetical protein